VPDDTLPDEKAFANAVAGYQTRKGLEATGIIDAQTWGVMQKDMPLHKFKPLIIPVVFGGKKLGYLEKTIPYTSEPLGDNNGARIEMGFRVTDWDAVKKAGFADDTGRPPFRWIQTWEFATVPAGTPAGFIRKHTHVVDPTSLVGVVNDGHPYYWDEKTPHDGEPLAIIDDWVNRPAQNNLCYDLIFFDFPNVTDSFVSAGRRAYNNFETALVGINHSDPTRNTILDTFTWGYDRLITKGKPETRLNHLGPGVRGGTANFKQIISKQIGDFPHHCFTGPGFSKAATCK
jgi:hypothetical protein